MVASKRKITKTDKLLEEIANKLANGSKKSWWAENKTRFIKSSK